jgi:hypothetical protein
VRREAGAAAPQAHPRRSYCGARGDPEDARFALLACLRRIQKPLLQWFKVLHLMLTSKKGMSALQIHRMLGYGSYKTSWYMCMRLRASLHDPDFQQLMGIVELDEMYHGGKAQNMHAKKRAMAS